MALLYGWQRYFWWRKPTRTLPMKLLIKNGRVWPANNIDGLYDILVENSKIAQVARDYGRQMT